MLKAARALSAVMEEGDADGRLAVLARVERIRAELGYYGAGPAARAVVDQYALAAVHAEAVRACAASVLPAQPPGDELSAAVVFNQIAQAHGVAVRTGASGDEHAIRARAWARRQERAERGLRSAERLVRHARKGGLLLAAVPSPSAPKPSRTERRGDPLAPLAVPYPPPVRSRLRGAAAKDAAAERARIDVMRAAWPPPERVRWRELRARDSPWSPWSYDFYYNDEGMIVEPAWARLSEAHETPDRALARLAEWAPEFALP